MLLQKVCTSAIFSAVDVVFCLYQCSASRQDNVVIGRRRERVPYRNSLAFVTLCLNLDGQLCWDLNPGARGVVAKHLPTRPRSLSTGYS